MQIKHIYDFWGIGLYWSMIEILREQDNYCFNSDESSLQLFSTLVMCPDHKKFMSFFNDCVRIGLFDIHDNVFYSNSLCKRMAKWESSKSNGNQGGRGNKKPIESETKANQNPTTNPTQTIREEKSIEEEKREEIPPNPQGGNQGTEVSNSENPKQQKKQKGDSPAIDWGEFLSFLNKATGKNLKVVNKKAKDSILARLKEGYTKKQISNAITNASRSEHHKENDCKWLTPAFFGRSDKLDMWGDEPQKKQTLSINTNERTR